MADKKRPKNDNAENIKVAVRVRPLNSKEAAAGYQSVVDLDLAANQVKVTTPCGAPDVWTFDYVFNNSFTQEDIFVQTVLPLVVSVMDGFNATIFAYGQSGSGKTYTMSGVLNDPMLQGVIPRCFQFIFNQIKEQSKQGGKSYRVMCSFMELYNNKARDLLSADKFMSHTLQIREKKDKTFFCEDLKCCEVKYEAELYDHMEAGIQRRHVASTELNADSSRSHSIFTVQTEVTSTAEDGTTRVVTSKLNLVDLAGSERQSKTGAQGDTLKEGCNINLSLSALGSVIDTLVKGKGHVPFRSSPLTMLLKDSLGGSSKTVMFANCGPSEHNVAETVSTLRFADRAKQIKNKPQVQMDPKDARIAHLEDRVVELQERLKQYETGAPVATHGELQELQDRVAELENELDSTAQENERLEAELKVVQDATRNGNEERSAEVEEFRRRIARFAEQTEQLEYEKTLAQQMGREAEGSSAELRAMVCEFLNETSKVVMPEQVFVEVPADAELDHLQSAFDTLKRRIRATPGDLRTKLDAELAQQRADFEARMDAHKEEADKVQALYDQVRGSGVGGSGMPVLRTNMPRKAAMVL